MRSNKMKAVAPQIRAFLLGVGSTLLLTQQWSLTQSSQGWQRQMLAMIEDVRAGAGIVDESSSTDNTNNINPTTDLENKEEHLLEDLLFKYGSDKSHDDHSYSDMYQMLFNPIRQAVVNVTEVGVSAGQSLQAWYHYFPNAEIHGYDIATPPSVPKIVDQMNDRIRFTETDLLSVDQTMLAEVAGLYDETMDVVIEDAMHMPFQQEAFLMHLWRLVKPGGYYIIEDINPHWENAQRWLLHPERLNPVVRDIMTTQGDTILVNTAVGHRAWDEWLRRTSSTGAAKDLDYHNSHLLILRKRVKPLPANVTMNLRVNAMQPGRIVLDD